ncbi:ROK family protein [Clostridium sp. C2-6-12]|uniref:ROK family protein n=1 Tax=Clostridium sp. C2-6-12 TaxID=2698832 RepID=UPI00192431BD|nr:ROK family protein [Clostridium sp. C2-6-12]
MKAYKGFELLNDRCKNIFNIIQKNGPKTKNELIDLTQIKLTTLNRELKTLFNEKIIVESHIGESTGGRKPSLYDVNQEEFYVVGIDISRTYTKIVVVNLKLEIISERLLSHDYNMENVDETIPSVINDLFSKLEIENSFIVGIGIGIVGGFNVTSLYYELTMEFDTRVYIDNGVNAAVIGEYNFGIGKGKKNISYINCGVGIRTGIISSGVLIRTINNVEDAFGHMIVEANGQQCSCGNLGCIEGYVSILNITDKFISSMKEINPLGLNKDLNNINYRDVCSLAENNNKVAMNIIKEAASYFGIGLSNYIKLFNPELIILSGPLIQHSKLFYDIAKETAMEKCHIKNNYIEFSNGGEFDDNSIAIGACAIVLEEVLN